MPNSLQFSHMNDADGFSNLQADPISFTLAGDNVVVSGLPRKRILVYRLFFVLSGDTTITFKDGIGTNLTGPMDFLSNGSLSFDISNIPWFQTSNANDFIISSSNSVQVSGAIYYQYN